jgi:Nucleoside-diphosphate-sugar epimerases
MRIAVTGSSGFIGSHVIRELQVQDHQPVEIDHQRGIDILSPDLLYNLEDCEGVIHLAGVLGTSELFDSAEAAVDVNVKGTLRVLQACQELGMRYVGITMPKVWDNVYQATKQCSRNFASAWHRHFDVPVSHVRAFNAFGPGQKIGLPQKIIPTFSAHALSGRPIPIWGDGTQHVDLVFVSDVARMLVDALQFGDDEVFDAGTGQAMTVNEVAYRVLSLAHSEAGVEYLPMRRGEHGEGVVATGEGWDKLGWKPHFTVDDLTFTVESYRSVIMGATWTQPSALS